jgi:hypothetical protein
MEGDQKGWLVDGLVHFLSDQTVVIGGGERAWWSD